jgi:hypothetical protein
MFFWQGASWWSVPPPPHHTRRAACESNWKLSRKVACMGDPHLDGTVESVEASALVWTLDSLR